MKNTLQAIRLTLGLGLLAAIAHSIPVSGILTPANSNWTGNIEVTGGITVPSNLTLTIAPGARIRSQGGKFQITADGPVKATGTLAGYIDFFDVNLVLNPSSSQHVMEYCVLLNSSPSAILVAGSDARFSHVQIQDFGTYGINISGASAKAILQYCTIGAKSRLFGGAEAISVNIGGGADAAAITISNSILGFENKAIQTGLSIKTAGGAAATSSTVQVKYSLITGTRVGSGAGEIGIITGADADVMDIPNLNYHLWSYSAAINAGDPGEAFVAEPAPNGGRVDMGYYGGTAEATAFQMKMVTPNGGDSLSPLAAATVKWQGGKLLGAKKLELSIDSGATWQGVVASTDAAGAGTHAWTVPTVKSPNCLMRVSLVSGGIGTDVSDRVFTIGDTVRPGGSGGTLKNPTPFRCIPFAAYHDGQAPGGKEPTLAEARSDLEIIAKYTKEIRTYGSGFATHGSALPGLCDQLGLSIHMGVWLDDTYPEATNQQSITEAIQLVNAKHPSIKTVIVGNEFLLRVRQAHGNEALAEAKLVRYIKQVKAAMPANIIVGTGESYPDWLAASDELVKAVDRVIWHVHPWWEQKAAENAGSHAYNVYKQMQARIAKFPGKPMVLGETGWPTAATTGAAVGSVQNQARYLKDLHAWAKKEKLDYWFFSNVDEKWKSAEGAVGANWGMWYTDRTPKHVITNLDQYIPPSTYWENDNGSVAISPWNARSKAGISLASSAGIRIYDLQGRLLGEGPGMRKTFGQPALGGGALANGFFVGDIRNR